VYAQSGGDPDVTCMWSNSKCKKKKCPSTPGVGVFEMFNDMTKIYDSESFEDCSNNNPAVESWWATVGQWEESRKKILGFTKGDVPTSYSDDGSSKASVYLGGKNLQRAEQLVLEQFSGCALRKEVCPQCYSGSMGKPHIVLAFDDAFAVNVDQSSCKLDQTSRAGKACAYKFAVTLTLMPDPDNPKCKDNGDRGKMCEPLVAFSMVEETMDKNSGHVVNNAAAYNCGENFGTGGPKGENGGVKSKKTYEVHGLTWSTERAIQDYHGWCPSMGECHAVNTADSSFCSALSSVKDCMPNDEDCSGNCDETKCSNAKACSWNSDASKCAGCSQIPEESKCSDTSGCSWVEKDGKSACSKTCSWKEQEPKASSECMEGSSEDASQSDCEAAGGTYNPSYGPTGWLNGMLPSADYTEAPTECEAFKKEVSRLVRLGLNKARFEFAEKHVQSKAASDGYGATWLADNNVVIHENKVDTSSVDNCDVDLSSDDASTSNGDPCGGGGGPTGGSSPDADSSSPDADSSSPDADSSSPDADSSSPDDASSSPDDDSSSPDADSSSYTNCFEATDEDSCSATSGCSWDDGYSSCSDSSGGSGDGDDGTGDAGDGPFDDIPSVGDFEQEITAPFAD